jgi:hypothetical protein
VSGPGQFGKERFYEVDDAVRQIYKGSSAQGAPAPHTALKELIEMSDDPAHRENLRKAFAQEMRNTVTKNGSLDPDAYKTFKARRPVLEQSGLFTPDELDKIQNRFSEAKKLGLHQNARKLPELKERDQAMLEATAAFLGAKAGARAFPGISLVGAQMGSKRARKLLDSFTNQDVRELAYQMTMEPEKFFDIKRKLKAGDLEMDKFWRQMALRAGIVLGAEQQD